PTHPAPTDLYTLSLHDALPISRNNPMVPKYVDQSQNVALNMPHDEGAKSRCRLVTMMMKRSSHMPTLTINAMMNSTTTFVRTRLIHSDCTSTTLHASSPQ